MSIVVICVEIMHSGNLGAIARLCDNYDVDRLILVNPQCEINKEAYDRATHGKRFLDEPIITKNLEEASKYADLLVALSARVGGHASIARSSIPIQKFTEEIDHNGSIGFVLGRENSGLTNEETDTCDLLVNIPLPGSNPVFNISHALAVALWEYVRNIDYEEISEQRLMTRAEKDAFMMMLENILPHVWIDEDKYYGVIRVYSMILGRAYVTSREANTLIGTLRAILRSLTGPHPPWDTHDK